MISLAIGLALYGLMEMARIWLAASKETEETEGFIFSFVVGESRDLLIDDGNGVELKITGRLVEYQANPYGNQFRMFFELPVGHEWKTASAKVRGDV